MGLAERIRVRVRAAPEQRLIWRYVMVGHLEQVIVVVKRTARLPDSFIKSCHNHTASY